MNAKGSVFKYPDNVDTDVIIPARHLNTQDPKELASHCMEDIDKDFVKNVKDGDIMVGGWNFGCGSSREHAPIAIKASGISCVIATTFARIFYRNSINIGLPVIISKDLYDKVEDGTDIDINLSEGWIKTEDETLPCTKLPPYMQNILDHGGLINFLNEGEE